LASIVIAAMRRERSWASGYAKTVLFTGIGNEYIASESEDSLFRWHLKHQVPIMRYGHEFGDRGTTKDSLVSILEISNYKVDVVSTEVVCRAKLHG
jgi:hypothetical protein